MNNIYFQLNPGEKKIVIIEKIKDILQRGKLERDRTNIKLNSLQQMTISYPHTRTSDQNNF